MVYGCREPKIDIRDYKINSKITMAINFPEEFELEHTRIKDQGQVGSCVAHATSSILEYHNKNRRFSTNFIYGMESYIGGDNEPGMFMSNACKIVSQYGDMLEKDCSGNTEVPNCTNQVGQILEDTDKLEKAKKYKIDSYYNCNTLNDIKFALMNYGPVLASIYWYDKYNVNEDGIINFDTTSDGGYHAIMIYGWDKNGLKIQNSWGYTFGIMGTFILPYKYNIAEAKILIDSEKENTDTLIKPQLNWISTKFYKLINYFKNKFGSKND